MPEEWKREISAGGVVYTDARSVPRLKRRGKKAQDQIYILLIKPSGKTHDQERKWTFPKGLMDDRPGMSVEDVAVAEVKEEGGVEAKIIEKLGSLKYTYKWEGKNIFKIVTWYLMEYVSGDPKDHDFEVAEAGWYELSEAEKMIGYKTDVELFKKVKKLLS